VLGPKILGKIMRIMQALSLSVKVIPSDTIEARNAVTASNRLFI